MPGKIALIAEIGENHFGSIALAKALLAAAAQAGADIVKFQSYHASDTAADDPERESFAMVELSDQDHFELMNLAKEKRVRFTSSPFTVERARFLVETLKLDEVKIASGKMRNAKLLDYLNSQAGRLRTVYLSTGTATIDEIRKSVQRLGNIRHLVIMHCVSAYPCEDADANLRAIVTLRSEFPQHEIGYSDHTRGTQACLAAVALGAVVLEKHFTYNQLMPGDDHQGAMTPQDLAELIRTLERLEKMLGTGEKTPTAAEKEIMPLLCDRFGD